MPVNPEYTNPAKQCPTCGRPVLKCAECGKTFYPGRSDAETCSNKCRVDRSRRLAKMRAAEALEAS